MYNPLPGIIPNYPIVQSITDMHLQVSELQGELKAVGCTVLAVDDSFVFQVPKGARAEVDSIMQRHVEKYAHNVSTVESEAKTCGGYYEDSRDW